MEVESGEEGYESDFRPADEQTEIETRIRIMYSSKRSLAHVCLCSATLYNYSGVDYEDIAFKDDILHPEYWKRQEIGYPTCVVSQRENFDIDLILASEKTAFAVWKCKVTSSSRYTKTSQRVHVFRSENKIHALVFKEGDKADEFYEVIQKFLEKRCNVKENSEESKVTRSRSWHVFKKKKTPKSSVKDLNVSIPVCFTHVTKSSTSFNR